MPLVSTCYAPLQGQQHPPPAPTISSVWAAAEPPAHLRNPDPHESKTVFPGTRQHLEYFPKALLGNEGTNKTQKQLLRNGECTEPRFLTLMSLKSSPSPASWPCRPARGPSPWSASPWPACPWLTTKIMSSLCDPWPRKLSLMGLEPPWVGDAAGHPCLPPTPSPEVMEHCGFLKLLHGCPAGSFALSPGNSIVHSANGF